MRGALTERERSDATLAEPDPLSVEEHLEKLEKTSRLNRLYLFAMAALLLISLLSMSSYAAYEILSDKSTAFSPEAFSALQQRADNLEQQLTALQQEQVRMEDLLKRLSSSDLESMLSDESTLSLSGNTSTLKLVGLSLLGQEQSLQQSLQTLKHGMRDLATMIPGSRSWLADYNEELNKIHNASVKRAKAIQNWTLTQAKQ